MNVRSIVCLLTCSALLVAAGAARSRAASADEDWDVFQRVWNASVHHPELNYSRLHPKAEKQTRVDQYRWAFQWFKDTEAATAQFFALHPEDPRRWGAVVRLHRSFTTWTAGYPTLGPEVVAAVNQTMTPAEQAECHQRLAAWAAELRASKDASADDRFYFDLAPVRERIAAAARNKLPGDAPEWSAIREEIEKVAARWPQAKPGNLVANFESARFPMGTDPKPGQADMERLAEAANPVIAEDAKTQLKNILLFGKSLAFTAVDGRKVNLADLKGKVVLVDFWATWCGPCKAELPNVQRVYAAYHDKGFEVVGISLENGHLKDGDTPEQTAQKLAAAKKVLTDFTTAHAMPWPQYFDGKYWQNDMAARYGIMSIPAMFLFGKDGTVVSTNARGPELEIQVKRLLRM